MSVISIRMLNMALFGCPRESSREAYLCLLTKKEVHLAKQ